MKAIVQGSSLEIKLDIYDDCAICANASKCPLIENLQDEVLILKYDNILIRDCKMYKSYKKETWLERMFAKFRQKGQHKQNEYWNKIDNQRMKISLEKGGINENLYR